MHIKASYICICIPCGYQCDAPKLKFKFKTFTFQNTISVDKICAWNILQIEDYNNYKKNHNY